MDFIIKQHRIAVIGMPDSGKSRFIQEYVKHYCGRDLSPDTLMNEVHYSDGKDPYGNPDTRTIKAAKVIINKKDWGSLCLMDCPGHLEYIDQIRQCIKMAHQIICVVDTQRLSESLEYLFKLLYLCGNPTVPTTHVFARSDKDNGYNFDTEQGYRNFIKIIEGISYEHAWVDLEEEALARLSSLSIGNKDIFLYSGGKDSVVGLHLLSRVCGNNMPYIGVPTSGYDFEEVTDFIRYTLENSRWEKFDNSGGMKYGEVSNYQMMLNKAEANMRMVKEELPEYLFVNYRASDEGVRSKDNWIKDCGFYSKVSPVFNFSEVDIWRYIKKYSLPICSLYYKGYRSLGDEPVTVPCMPEQENVDGIIDWLISHPETQERDGRKAQDNSENFAMEKLRNVGFF